VQSGLGAIVDGHWHRQIDAGGRDCIAAASVALVTIDLRRPQIEPTSVGGRRPFEDGMTRSGGDGKIGVM